MLPRSLEPVGLPGRQIITIQEVFKYECNQLHDFPHIYATTFLWTLPFLHTIVAGDHLLYDFLWPCSLAVPVLARWVYAFCGSMSRNSEGSTGSGSGFKLSQKTGQRLKVSSDRLGETDWENKRYLLSDPVP